MPVPTATDAVFSLRRAARGTQKTAVKKGPHPPGALFSAIFFHFSHICVHKTPPIFVVFNENALWLLKKGYMYAKINRKKRAFGHIFCNVCLFSYFCN